MHADAVKAKSHDLLKLSVISLYCSMETESVACIWTAKPLRPSLAHRIRQRRVCLYSGGQTLAVHTCSGFLSKKGWKDVSALFYLLEWIWCASPRRLNIGSTHRHFALLPPLFLFLCCTRAGAVQRETVWGLLLDSCCDSILNWAPARWSHDGVVSSTVVAWFAA